MKCGLMVLRFFLYVEHLGERSLAVTNIIRNVSGILFMVLMAATTTILGMIPLLFDIAFGGMAATIIFGLTFATLLTLFVTPALYVLFYKVKIK